MRRRAQSNIARAAACAGLLLSLASTARAQDANQPVKPVLGPPADQSAMSEAANPPEQIDTGDAWGDDMAGLRAGPLTFHLLLQPRYSQTYAEPSRNPRPGYAVREDILVRDGDGWSLQRFFFRIGADPEPWVGFKAILDFAKLRGSDVSNVLKQAYARLRPMP